MKLPQVNSPVARAAWTRSGGGSRVGMAPRCAAISPSRKRAISLSRSPRATGAAAPGVPTARTTRTTAAAFMADSTVAQKEEGGESRVAPAPIRPTTMVGRRRQALLEGELGADLD